MAGTGAEGPDAPREAGTSADAGYAGRRLVQTSDYYGSVTLTLGYGRTRAGRVGSGITLRCVELAGSIGYSEHELLEKWARDSKILDIFEGTQQIQQLIVARRLLGKSSAELK